MSIFVIEHDGPEPEYQLCPLVPHLAGKRKNPRGQMQPTPPVERANTVLKGPSAVQNEDGRPV